jgi:hypothetical protein
MLNGIAGKELLKVFHPYTAAAIAKLAENVPRMPNLFYLPIRSVLLY